jgi:hypothetical protein
MWRPMMRMLQAEIARESYLPGRPSKGAPVRVLKAVLASLAVVVLMGFFVPALAAPGSGDDPPEVQPNVIQKSDKTDPEVLSSNDGVLPFTGGQVMLFVVIGVGAIGAGTFVLRSSRRGSVDPV